MSFLTQCFCLGGISSEPVEAWGKQDYMGFGKHVISKIWIGSTGKQLENRVDNFPRIHNIANSRRDPEQ